MRAFAVLLVACAHAPPKTPAAIQPDDDSVLRIRLDAARSLHCEAITLAQVRWAGKQGLYHASGCGFDVDYVVACDAPDRCGFTQY